MSRFPDIFFNYFSKLDFTAVQKGLVFILFRVGKISYMLQKSLNEIMKGMNSLDQRLSRIEEGLQSQNDSEST